MERTILPLEHYQETPPWLILVWHSLMQGGEQTVGTTVALATAAAVPIVAAGTTELATSGAAATFGAAALETIKDAASSAGAGIVVAGTAVATFATKTVSATAGAAVKVVDAASDLYAKAGVLFANLKSGAENVAGPAGKMINIGIGIGKEYVNSQVHSQLGSGLPASGDKAMQATGMIISKLIKAAGGY